MRDDKKGRLHHLIFENNFHSKPPICLSRADARFLSVRRATLVREVLVSKTPAIHLIQVVDARSMRSDGVGQTKSADRGRSEP